MKQKNGIICLETEWEHTIERNRRSIHTKPLLEFLEKSSECEIIYRRVATKMSSAILSETVQFDKI